ncbi:MAG: hypothetical protein IJY27_00715 [Clostridia bacterium]|nr:hypothetical protein [Clostridia bacterium]
MKNEFLARAMTHIDSALIEEANATPVRNKFRLSENAARGIYRWGSLAACAILLVGMLLINKFGSNDVLLYGESITAQPRTIAEYMPRAVTYAVDPAALTSVSLPLELEFERVTELTAEHGNMIVLDENGETVYSGDKYTADGAISLCIQLPPEMAECVISTNRGYNIVLELDSESGLWYVNIEK